MRDNLTDITIVLDRSGSMASVRDDTVGGFDTFVKDQQEVDGDCLLTLVQFDDQDPFEVVYSARPVAGVPSLADSFHPRGMTPLLDAIGRTIASTGERLSKMDESDRPGKVIFVVITDGHENSSREYTKTKVKELIERQTNDYSWEFVYIGATADAISEGTSIGISGSNVIRKSGTGAGERSTYESLSVNLASFRKGDASSMAYSDGDRQAAMSQ